MKRKQLFLAVTAILLLMVIQLPAIWAGNIPPWCMHCPRIAMAAPTVNDATSAGGIALFRAHQLLLGIFATTEQSLDSTAVANTMQEMIPLLDTAAAKYQEAFEIASRREYSKQCALYMYDYWRLCYRQKLNITIFAEVAQIMARQKLAYCYQKISQDILDLKNLAVDTHEKLGGDTLDHAAFSEMMQRFAYVELFGNYVTKVLLAIQ